MTHCAVKRGNWNMEKWAAIWRRDPDGNYLAAGTYVLGPLLPKPSDWTLEGNEGVAYAVAIDGSTRIVVGAANNELDGEYRAFIVEVRPSGETKFTVGSMLDLNDPYLTLLPDDSWFLEAARGIVIDDQGRRWITGNGWHNNQARGWILEEQPENTQ